MCKDNEKRIIENKTNESFLIETIGEYINFLINPSDYNYHNPKCVEANNAPALIPTITQVPTFAPTPNLTAISSLKAYQESCSTPKDCAQWLVDHDWDLSVEKDTKLYGNRIPSPAEALMYMVGSCGPVALTIAAGVADDGYSLNILTMLSENRQSGHGVYVFQDLKGLWSYVQLSPDADKSMVDYQEPIYRNIDELFFGFVKHHQPYDSYSLITEKDLVPKDWMTTMDSVEWTVYNK